MNTTKLNCSLNDTTRLRNLILENPDLPLLIFCGEDSWHDEYPYEQAEASDGEVKELTMYNNYWMDKGDYEDILSDDLCDKEDSRMIKRKVAETEFVKAIVIYVG